MFWHAQQHAAKIPAVVKDGGKSGMVPLSLNLEGQHGPASGGRLRRLRAAGDDALQPLLD